MLQRHRKVKDTQNNVTRSKKIDCLSTIPDIFFFFFQNLDSDTGEKSLLMMKKHGSSGTVFGEIVLCIMKVLSG